MPAISGSLQNLINGVSRQPMAVRLPTQLDEQINGTSTPAKGQQKRPPTFHVQEIGSGLASNIFTHDINRDRAERYHVLVSDGDLRVFDQFGNEKTVAFPLGKDYLNAVDPISMFAATTSADHTFITNKTVTTEMDPASATADVVQEALVFIRAVNFSRDYRIFIDGVVSAFLTTTGGSFSDSSEVHAAGRNTTPIKIAQVLAWGDNDNSTAGHPNGDKDGNTEATWSGWIDGTSKRLVDTLPYADWIVKRYANVIHIKRRDGTPFTIRCEGDRTGGSTDNLIAIKEVIQDFTDLPNHGPEGFVIEVAGKPTDGTDNYWVKLSKPEDDDNNDSIVWRECPKPGTLCGFVAATLPHILRRETDGSFTLTEADWGVRRCGDDEFAPAPSFIGGTVRDVFFHRGRLGFLCNESVIFTRPSLFFDFWRLTMTTDVDDDPIDVAGTDDVVSIFESAVTFDENLFIVSDQTMHKLSAGDLLTQKSVKLTLSIKEPIDITVAPVATSRSIYFAAATSTAQTQVNYGDIRELYVADDTEKDLATSVSDHVPGYITRNIRKLLSSPANNILLVLPSDASGTIFVYQYYWAGEEKLQSAWHKWELGSGVTVLGGAMWDDEMHLVLQRGVLTYLERIPVRSHLADVGRQWMIRLDRRVSTSQLSAPTYSALDQGSTSFSLPYAVGADTVAVFGPTDSRHGIRLDVVSFTGNTIVLVGDQRTSDLVFGKSYTHLARLSELLVRTQRHGAAVTLQVSRFQILRIFPQFVETSHFRAEVTPSPGAPVRSKGYSPYTGVDADSVTDAVILRNGVMGIPVNGKSTRAKIELINDTHLPASFTGLEWEGHYVPRTRGM